MAYGRVTLRDIARVVGVHPSTVSRALNPATRDMVTVEIAELTKATAERLGYRPNRFAQSLKTNRSATIGVLIPDLTNPVFPPIIKGIDTELEPTGYTVVIANSDNQPERERIFLERFRERQVDGLILATAHLEDPVAERYLREGHPFVLVNRTTRRDGMPSVVGDDVAGIQQLIKHLIALGHRQIAHVAGPQDISTGWMRYETFKSSLRAAGLEVEPALVTFAGAFTEDAGRRAAGLLIERGWPFTAIVAGNDLIALGCIDGLTAAGLNCPKDISVTGYNDMPLVDRLDPPLTTIHIPLAEMGAYAARMLIRHLEGEPSKPQTVRLVPQLRARGSTGPMAS